METTIFYEKSQIKKSTKSLKNLNPKIHVISASTLIERLKITRLLTLTIPISFA